MLGLSFPEIIVVVIITIIVIKPEDIPTIIKYFRQLKNLISNLQQEFSHMLKDLDANSSHNFDNNINNNSDSFAEQVKELNYYIEKIHARGITYNGDYEISEVKKFYFNQMKNATTIPKNESRKKNTAKNSKT